MKRQNYIIASMAVLTLFSCNKMENNTGAGRLTLGVAIPETKAAMGAEDLLNTAKVNIYYADFSGLVRSYTYSEAPEEIWLPANEYRVDVIAGEAAKAAPAPASWEQKSYSGSRNFTIQAGKGTSVEVVAGVSNAISKVSFDSSVADNFQNGYTFTIGVEDASLVYDASRSGAEGYFLIAGKDEPEFAWTFDGILSKDGASFSKSGVISGLEAGKVYAMNLKYSLKDGIGTFDLFVDYTTTVIEDNILFEPVSTGLSASAYRDIWAAHATVYADVDETEYSDASAIAFAFSPDGATWTSVPAERMAEGSYRAVLGNLAPETEYTYKLVIAGDSDFEDSYSSQLKQMAKKNNVILTGFIKGRRLHALLNHTRCYVLPSSHEGLPIALLEAMSYGAPILVSDISANLEVGLPKKNYFTCGDVLELTARLQEIVDMPYNKCAYDMEKYDWDVIAQQVDEVYQKIDS